MGEILRGIITWYWCLPKRLFLGFFVVEQSMTLFCLEKKKVTGEIFSFCDYTDSSERLLGCGYCRDVAVYRLPDSFPVQQVKCDCCGKRGEMSMGLSRRER